jgi:hypothetical protein
MSERKFRVVKETRVGALDEQLYAEWRRLSAAQDDIDAGFEAFWDTVMIGYADQAIFHLSPPRLRIGDDGDIFASFCQCPACQARLHGLTVSETVEEMYRSDLISNDAIATVRQKARALDATEKTSKKLLN